MLSALRENCTKEGFDLCDPIHTQWYNNLIEDEGHVAKGTLQKIPEPPTIIEDRDEEEEEGEDERPGPYKYNAVLIGNSKSIWPKFINWLSSKHQEKLGFASESNDESKQEILNELLNDNPFDTFVTETLSQVFQSCCAVTTKEDTYSNTSISTASQLESYEFFWSNGINYKVDLKDGKPIHLSKNGKDYHCYVDTTNENNDGDENRDNSEKNKNRNRSFLVSMQRVAKITGKYWHDDEGTKLCVHPKFGTWKAFRAVVVFHYVPKERSKEISKNCTTDTDIIPKSPPLCPCPVDPNEIQNAKEVMEYALKMSTSQNSGYGDSDQSSSDEKDLCTYLHNSVTSGSEWSKVSPTMRPWIQLRDCISVGREDYKYCDNQLLYHYTKDTEILKKELFSILK